MSGKVMGTSQWIAFFRKAGLPANVSANYAIIFSDNRIQLDMLLDLSKEYLYDMGIKVMGDVIAILKYAKEFHNQLVKEKLIGPTPLTPNNNTTVAERMVGRYTRPVVSSPIQFPMEIDKGLQKKQGKIISLKRKSLPDEAPVQKIRRVPPEEEGAYKIKMPSGTTEKTRKLLQQHKQLTQVGQKRSVFSRLGDSAVSSSTDSTKVSSSVFERLGPSNKNIRDDLPSSTVVNEFERPSIKGQPLQYRGVLKMTVGKRRTIVETSPKKAVNSSRTVITRTFGRPNIVKTVMNLNQIKSILQTNKSPVLRTATNPATTQGIFANRKIGSLGSNVKNRLGQKVDARNLARTKILSTSRASTKSESSVFSRLGR